MENNELRQKVEILEQRISKLENIEKRRQRAKWVRIIFKIITIAISLVLLYIGYKYVMNYLEPYKGTIDELQKQYGTLKESTSSFSLDEILGNIKNY